jgi:antitoxin VapB
LIDRRGRVWRKEDVEHSEEIVPLNIKDPEAQALARELAAATGETITRAVHMAVRERLQKVRVRKSARQRLADRLDQIARHCAALPVLHDRPADEILGYDGRGLPPDGDRHVGGPRDPARRAETASSQR